MDDELRELRKIVLVREISDEALTRFAALGARRSYVPGEIIILQGEVSRGVYFILEGSVRVYRLSAQGREQVLARLNTGQAFNTVPPFLCRSLNHATVSALTPVTLYVVPLEEFRRFVTRCPELAQVMLVEFATRLDRLTDMVESLALHTVRGRLARFLLEHARPDNCVHRWTQDEIAAHIGTVRDMVNRTLRIMTDAGLIRMDREAIVLVDRAGLEAEAQN